MALVQASNVSKDYEAEDVTVHTLREVTFDIEPASFVGPSGSGRTTLLNLIGCLDKPPSGQLLVAGTDIAALDRKGGAAFRGKHLGFIFQDFNLIPVLTVYENIEYPLIMVQDIPPAESRERVASIVDAVGMSAQAAKYPPTRSPADRNSARRWTAISIPNRTRCTANSSM